MICGRPGLGVSTLWKSFSYMVCWNTGLECAQRSSGDTVPGIRAWTGS